MESENPQLSPVAPRPGDEIRTERLLAYREGYACGKMDGFDAGFAAAREAAARFVEDWYGEIEDRRDLVGRIRAIQPEEKK